MAKYQPGGGPYPNQSYIAVMTVAQRDASKANIGAMIYQTDDGRIYIYDGSAWGYIDLTA